MIEYSPSLLDALFEQTNQAAFVFDRDTLAFLLVNRAACELYGWSREEMLAMTLRDIRPEEDIKRLEHVVADKRDVAGNFTRISRHRSRGGRVFDVAVDIRRVKHEGRDASLALITDVGTVSEAERRARLLVEMAGDGLSVTAEDGHIIYMNPAGERMLGYLPGELVGHDGRALGHPDDLAAMGAALQRDPLTTRISRTLRKDGTWISLEVTTTDLRLDPAIRGYISSFRDITQRVETERALRETTKRLTYLLSATSAVTYTARAAGDFATTYVSPNVREVLGWDASAFREATFWRERVHPEDRAIVETGLAQLFEHGEHALRYRFQHADGSYRWILDGARLHGDGKGAEIVGYVVDITDRTRAEHALALSEASFRSVIELAPTMTLVHRGGIVVYANRALSERLHIPLDEMVGMNALDQIHPDDRPAIAQQITNTAEGRSTSVEARMLSRDGQVVIVRCVGVRVEFGGAPAHVVFITDLTAERELYARMAIADRLVSLGTLAAGVAHEINNPLAFVVGNIELLARELPAIVAGTSRLPLVEVQELLADARDGALRVGSIVRDLRALSRSDDARASSVDIVPVLQSCLKMMHTELRGRARIVEDLPQGLPPVCGNGSRLSQVILNLLVNASHAIPEGAPDANTIRIGAHCDGTYVHIDVADTGAGIPQALLGRIFDPFFTTKPVGQGTGLGLAISHEIVRSLGGRITVDSTVGEGTVFHIALPVARPAPAVTEAARSRLEARVLLVDDEVAVGRSIAALLAPDIEVVAVTRARDAIDRIRRGEQFDTILCDLAMPELPGDELYRVLAETSPAHAQRIVFMSGGAPGVRPPEGRPLLEKPFTEEQLRAAITSVARRA
ncbi:MAG: PAS domain S-box protein [Deltaproteobacteria bacterium]|nr:PAS domain S-box protein [Deltaproteobacteria bacterium]